MHGASREPSRLRYPGIEKRWVCSRRNVGIARFERFVHNVFSGRISGVLEIELPISPPYPPKFHKYQRRLSLHGAIGLLPKNFGPILSNVLPILLICCGSCGLVSQTLNKIDNE